MTDDQTMRRIPFCDGTTRLVPEGTVVKAILDVALLQTGGDDHE